jgi:hypothetical protein
MSLAAREQQILDGMETALQAGETRLTSMFAIFTRLSRDEEIPGTEELAVRSQRPRSWLKAPRAGLAGMPGGGQRPGPGGRQAGRPRSCARSR